MAINNTTLYGCIGVIALVIVIAIAIGLSQRAARNARTSENFTAKRQAANPPAAYNPKSVATGTPVRPRERIPAEGNHRYIFISYRRSDSQDITDRIYDRLKEKFGEGAIFKDVDSIPLGTDFKEYLNKSVGQCNVLLAVMGKTWLDVRNKAGTRRLDDPADAVRIEVETALAKGIPVIPLLVGGAEVPSEDQLPDSLKKLVYRNGMRVRPDPDFHYDMNRLTSALDEILH